MEDEKLQKKRERAKKYASEPERFTIRAIALEMRSEHGVRLITYDDEGWHCTCNFFQEHGTCSHTMAAERLLTSLGNGEERGGAEKNLLSAPPRAPALARPSIGLFIDAPALFSATSGSFPHTTVRAIKRIQPIFMLG
jgi:hypothetical protein